MTGQINEQTTGETIGRATGRPDAWTLVDTGWGRRAADFATLSEPGNCREYVALHHKLGVGHGDRRPPRSLACHRLATECRQ